MAWDLCCDPDSALVILLMGAEAGTFQEVAMSDPAQEPLKALARQEAIALAERAGIDQMDDHDLFIDDLASILVAFAKTAAR